MGVIAVSPDDVKEIIDTTISDTQLEAFINAATVTINSLLGSLIELSQDQLFEITRWYCAHLLSCTKERQIMKENIGDTGATYSGSTGKGFSATLYGQQCLLFDVTGTLTRYEQQLGKKAITMFAIPSFSETENYD